jgi:purine-binding chemotaxis protein CheW
MAETAQTLVDTQDVETLGGKYLTFELANEIYGIGILRVREIIKVMGINTVPRLPEYAKGVINLRGHIIPVVDLRQKLSMASFNETRETCIIVVDLGNTLTGLIVDKVAEVLYIKSNQIENAPTFGAEAETDFILGMGKTDERVVILLDIDKVLDAEALVIPGTAGEQIVVNN